MADPDDTAELDRDLQLGPARVRLTVRSGDTGWDELHRELDALPAARCTVLADPGTPPGLLARIRPGAPVLRTDGAATLSDVERLAERLLAAGAGRDTVLLAVGGPDVADLGGLLAALLFQGCRLVQVPTTLGALCGPALSLRHTVASGVLGAWHAPQLVLGQLDLLDRQPADGLRADLAEVVRHVLAVCPGPYDRVAASLRREGRPSRRELVAYVALCADARAAVLAYDPQERGPGLALEYGRTLGRAIRLLCGGDLPVGHADALGMLTAARIAVRLGLLDREGERAHLELLAAARLPLVPPVPIDPAAFPAAVRLAAARSGRRGLVLLDAPGQPHCTDGSLLTDVDDATLRHAADALADRGTVPAQAGGGAGTGRGARVPGTAGG
ncbi:3-dehydroquinate synthase family protein [Kitasatospora cinereorecta]|uniref:3-dehydroquinate synthase n=1 Tax=Kitasatospora cinereorecta TaxID=285560 RepID=A0ABW0V8Y3_9ACTN